jgi:DNA-binding transcriptional regulator YdaS (Cro superfamily)
MADFTNEQRRYINASALATKWKVSPQYVSQLLKGDKKANSEVAINIINDAIEIIKIIENSPNLNSV